MVQDRQPFRCKSATQNMQIAMPSNKESAKDASKEDNTSQRRPTAQTRQIGVTIKQRGDSPRCTLKLRRSRQILSSREKADNAVVEEPGRICLQYD